jgi:hypothetical protein
MHKALWLTGFCVLWMACSRDVHMGPREPSGGLGGGGLGGAGGASGAPQAGGGASSNAGTSEPTTNALTVNVEDIEGIEIELVTISCAGDCVHVVAVAHGGLPPYRFAWEDGVTNHERALCLDASTTLEVSVTDTGIDAGEFVYEAQTAKTELIARVLECPDGGVIDLPQPDAAVADANWRQGVCISNGSFKADVTGAAETQGFHADAWQSCTSTPDILTLRELEAIAPSTDVSVRWPPTDGDTYLSLLGDSAEAVGHALCVPLEAGERYGLQLDAHQTTGNPTQLLLYGSNAGCASSQLLWQSTELIDEWRTQCITFTADATITHIRLEAVELVNFGLGPGRVLVDNVMNAGWCTPPAQ